MSADSKAIIEARNENGEVLAKYTLGDDSEALDYYYFRISNENGVGQSCNGKTSKEGDRISFFINDIESKEGYSLGKIFSRTPLNIEAEIIKIPYYQDLDGDGYGNAEVSQEATEQPDGYVLDNTDCDDNQATVYPEAPELNDDLDNDCDGETDEGWETYYQDSDKDGYGNADVSKEDTEQPDGYVLDNTDCDDNQATVYPGAPELNDDLDNDCDGETDEGWGTYYQDSDKDGYGNADVSKENTEQPDGYVANNTDCDDIDPTVYPGAEEIFDGKDNNCDGQTDEGCNIAPIAYSDDYSIDEDVTMEIGTPGILANDTDANGDTLTAALITGPEHGNLILRADGSFSYLPALNFNGSDSFTYVGNDGQTNSNPAIITLTVNPIDDEPVVDAGPDKADVPLGEIQLDGIATDIDGVFPLIPHWQIIDEPYEGAGQLTGADMLTPKLIIGGFGTYEVELEVCDSSRPERV